MSSQLTVHTIAPKLHDNAILAVWLVHCISVTGHYTYVWPHMAINATNVSSCGKPSFVYKKYWMRNKQIRWAVYKRNTRNYGQCRPSNNEKAITGSKWKLVQRYVQNFKYELRDFTHSWRLRNKNNLYLKMLPHGLLVLVAPIFQNRKKKCQNKNWMFFWRGFARLRGRKMPHCQFTKVQNPSESHHWSFPSLAAAQQTPRLPGP